MRADTFNELGSKAPPSPSRLERIGILNKEIHGLEESLGIPSGEPIWDTLAALRRLAFLKKSTSGNIAGSAATPAARANELEAELGLPKGAPSATLEASKLRVSHLEQLLSSRKTSGTAAALPPVSDLTAIAPAQVPNCGAVLSAARFLALAPDAQAVFSATGGAVSVDAFNSLPPAARIKHFNAGGRIVATATDTARRVPATDNRPASGGIPLTAFQNLGKGDQATMIRLGVQITAK